MARRCTVRFSIRGSHGLVCTNILSRWPSYILRINIMNVDSVYRARKHLKGRGEVEGCESQSQISVRFHD